MSRKSPADRQRARLRALVLPALATAAVAEAAQGPSQGSSEPEAKPAVALPKSEPFTGVLGLTRETSKPSFPHGPSAPAGAPNVVLILLDDVGFGAAGAFGGPVATPELDKLARGGLRYNAFNTTAISSPTRAALLTGRNQHQVGFGNLADVAAGFPATTRSGRATLPPSPRS